MSDRTAIVIPKLGQSMEEAEITAWLKPHGSAVAESEPLLEIETDKATFTIASPADGTLEIGSEVGEVLAITEVAGWVVAS